MAYYSQNYSGILGSALVYSMDYERDIFEIYFASTITECIIGCLRWYYESLLSLS